MRTGTWRKWLAVGILAALGLNAARAQPFPSLAPALPPTPRPAALGSDTAPPPVPPPTGLAPMPLPRIDMPVAVPIDAPLPPSNGHPVIHTVDGPCCSTETGSFVFWG